MKWPVLVFPMQDTLQPAAEHCVIPLANNVLKEGKVRTFCCAIVFGFCIYAATALGQEAPVSASPRFAQRTTDSDKVRAEQLTTGRPVWRAANTSLTTSRKMGEQIAHIPERPVFLGEKLKVIDKLLPLHLSEPRPHGVQADTIMLHFSSDPEERPDDPCNVDHILGVYQEAKVSAHFLIARDGTIYRLVDDERKAYHAGIGLLPWDPESRRNDMNGRSIGIEFCAIGSERDMEIFINKSIYARTKREHPELFGFTDEQYGAANRLIGYLLRKHPQILRNNRQIVGHEEYAPNRRRDPGELFDWSRIGLEKNGLRRDRKTTATAGEKSRRK